MAAAPEIAPPEIDRLLRDQAHLMARGRTIAAARRGRSDPPTGAERRAILALAADLTSVVEALGRRSQAQGRDFETSSRRVSACLAYLRVGRILAAPHR